MEPPTLSCTYTNQRNCMTSPHEPSGNLKKKHIWLRYELIVKTLFLLKKVLWMSFDSYVRFKFNLSLLDHH